MIIIYFMQAFNTEGITYAGFTVLWGLSAFLTCLVLLYEPRASRDS